ncbi:MAG: hypothetical protein NZ551_01330 [Microscillaceae bacterium]|nr:hypothetical protein [Microscillaceae bacterium]MDW8459831.1 hypothetical protein [Cytophagales bacterium]
MEVILFSFIFVFVLIAQLLLGKHITPVMRDLRRYKEGIELVKQKKYEEAVIYFDTLKETHPQSAVVWAYSGIAHFYLGDYYHTLAYCQKALEIDYTLTQCYFYKGRAFFELEDYEKACQEFEKNLWHSRHKLPEVYRYLGQCYLALNKEELALKNLQKAVQMQDEDANYLLMQLVRRNSKHKKT